MWSKFLGFLLLWYKGGTTPTPVSEAEPLPVVLPQDQIDELQQVTVGNPPTGYALEATLQQVRDNQLPDGHNVTVTNPTADPETGLAKEANQLPNNHQVTVSNHPANFPLPDAQAAALTAQGAAGTEPWPIEDLGERDEEPENVEITAAGVTNISMPASGNRYRLKRIIALNRLTAVTSPLITIRLGTMVVVANYAIAMRQRILGPIDGALTVELDIPGEVAFTYIIEEVTP